MNISMRRLAIATTLVVLFGLAVGVFWAARPLDDAVPVGVDYTPTLSVPPEPARLLSVDVECNTLFSSNARGDTALPVLPEQPDGVPPLDFQREPCELVHRNARIVLAVNIIAIGLALAALGVVASRVRRRPDAGASSSSDAVVASSPG